MEVHIFHKLFGKLVLNFIYFYFCIYLNSLFVFFSFDHFKAYAVKLR